jgi:Ca2+-transporting ATPase
LNNCYSKNIAAVLKELNTEKNGLSHEEAEKRLVEYGSNEIKETEKISPIKIFIDQFKNFLVGILFFALIVSLVVGERLDALVIGIILIINGILGFIQEFKAEKAIQALKKMASLQANVIRDGKEKRIPAKDLVPGDIIILETGEKIPADSRLIESINLHTQEAALTGESVPIQKISETLKSDLQVADMKNMVFSGTIITSGRGKAVVASTGMSTEIGKIAKMIQEEGIKLTPLQQRLKKLGHYLGIGIILICIVIFLAGVLIGIEKLDMLMVAISLAVAAIPEGLPAIVTIALAIGTQRMVKRHALIRKLPSVETLGSTTVICTDKTGTLTMNEMTVKKIFINDKIIEISGTGYDQAGDFSHNGKTTNPKECELLLRIGALCNNAKIDDQIIGDPTEACLIVSAAKAGIIKSELQMKYPRLGELEFTSERKRMSTLNKIEGKKLVYCKGAPDVIIDLCDRIYKHGSIERLTKSEKEKILKVNEDFSKQALRVLGFAYKESEKLDENNLIFVGLQAMIDPPRPGVKDAIEKCRKAGIKVVMITGDYKITAEAIGREIGLFGNSIDGKELESIKDLGSLIDDTIIYARVNPEHKVRILEALKKKGHIVAMTGDGVNDAPAIKKADMGIAMGITGTDVAKEASDMILTDDNFISIVNAIEEGRTIYDNIRRFIQYLLSSNVGEVLTIFAAIMIAPFFGHHIPLTALQILWINLVTDGLPALGLGVEPAEKNIMEIKPRNPKENLINRSRMIQMIIVGMIMMIGTLSLFKYYDPEQNQVHAETVAFTVLVLFQMFYVLNLRSDIKSFFVTNPLTNIRLMIAVLISIALQAAVVYVPFLQKSFETVALSLKDWLIIILVSSSVLWYGELVKLYKKYKYNVVNSFRKEFVEVQS